jgi:short subunit dehydrogenase-like uncharacterized protein
VLATDWTLGSVLWAMIVFFFWTMAIWIFISLFADIFRRNNLTGWAKAGWIALLFILPLIGALIYMIARPKVTDQDREMMERAQGVQRRVEGYSRRTRSRSSRRFETTGRSLTRNTKR